MKTISILIATVVVALAIAGASSTSFAISVPPSSEYTAHFCQSHESTIEYSWSRLYNTSSTADVTFHCPIVNTYSGRIGWLEAKVVDRHYDRDIRCTVKNLLTNEYLATGWWQTLSSSGSDANVQTLGFGSIGGTGTYHHFTMNCTVPRTYSGNRSSINGYRVFEN